MTEKTGALAGLSPAAETVFAPPLDATPFLVELKKSPPIARPVGTASPFVGRSFSAAPSVVGYEILGELGRGGMGVVYQARRLALKRTVRLIDTLARAIHFAHQQRVVHRDLKPANIRLQHKGEGGSPAGAAELRPGSPLYLETNCLKCMEKEPTRRYSSAPGVGG